MEKWCYFAPFGAQKLNASRKNEIIESERRQVMNKEDAIRYLARRTWYIDDPAGYDLLIIARPYWQSGSERVFASYSEKWVLKGTFNDLVENFIQKYEVCRKTAIEKHDSENYRNMGVRLTVGFVEAYVEDGKPIEDVFL